MNRGKALACTLLALALVIPGMAAFAAAQEVLRETREWTVMIYLGADGDFYENEDGEIADFTLKQLRKALVSPYDASFVDQDDIDVHLVVMVDTLGPSGTYIHNTESLSSDPENKDFDYLPAPAFVLGEKDSSDPATLSWFVDYALTYYPATKNLLFIKNGHAWCGACPDVNMGDVQMSGSRAETAMMSIDSIAMVLDSHEKAEGENAIDVLTLDGDNMASLEAAYELRNAIDYFVASQQDVPLDGFAYYLTLSKLVKESMDGKEVAPRWLSAEIAKDYVFYYNNTQGKKVLLPHMLSNSQMPVTASAFQMIGDGGEDNLKLMADRFMDIIRYMLYGQYPDGVGGYYVYDDAYYAGPEYDDVLEYPLWDWVPYHRNAIASARDFALIGKMADQAGYEWLPDVQSWVHMLQAYVSVYAADYGWNEDPKFCELAMEFKEAYNNSRVTMAQCQILDRSGNSDPNGLNVWFPQNWLHWEDLDMTRTRSYAYDGLGSNVDIPEEYYCVDCPLNYSECGFDFITDYAAISTDKSPHTELWIQFYGFYYEARWLLYSSVTGQDKPQTG
jgi:hypothetical protein